MGRRNVLTHYKLFDSDSLSSNVTSEKINIENLDQASINIAWSGGGTPIGVLTVEVSNSTEKEFTQGNEQWSILDFGVAMDVSGNSGDHQIIFDSMPFRYLRLKYTRSSGTATMTAVFHAENIGA